MLAKSTLLFALAVALFGAAGMVSSLPVADEKRCINQQCAPPAAREEFAPIFVAFEARCIGRQCSPMARDDNNDDKSEVAPAPEPASASSGVHEKKCIGRQ
ncbi:hypothetical protein I316_01502 [Kwoniella heveanensis BCC8398]|uniref:Uncharacterized protein n=1 Tax=Kwoniella heveanensis BCC8398 TaxID=1296120 RepID=A0A1B9H0Y2_9TREE|nr:hypothetical protein I316_01502 [Kwoniella heveanensis BCC8398]